jgi:glucose-6-phosphate dehydrogenase assembly protein OpcA
VVGDQAYAVEVPDDLLQEAAEFHARLDRDMDRGWQMSREFVPQPDRLQRCQIVADRLLTSLMQGNEATAMLMAGYIALRMPGAVGVDIDATGEMQNTELLFA